ncbi:MAG: hypothetical protein B6U89_05540 [Desulfurococcales archaeon ex4484_58]|nr:MAG: hypothetical protein B6U89_05540 [Desulfurococcales archaeon ex4484_58]
MVVNKLLYSRKFLGLILFILYIVFTYITWSFSQESIIYGTLTALIILLYLAYYAHLHRSAKEVLALTTFISIAVILGSLTGTLINGFTNIGALMYALTLSLAISIQTVLLSKLYKI